MILPKKLGVEATSKNLNDLKLRKANGGKGCTGEPRRCQGICRGAFHKRDHPDPESGRGWKNIRFCILQGNLRGQQKKQLNLDIDKKKTSAGESNPEPWCYQRSGTSPSESNRKSQGLGKRGVIDGRGTDQEDSSSQY